jgi:hypothetical protein
MLPETAPLAFGLWHAGSVTHLKWPGARSEDRSRPDNGSGSNEARVYAISRKMISCPSIFNRRSFGSRAKIESPAIASGGQR